MVLTVLPTTADSNMDQRIDNVAGVTLKDGGYTKLAKEAVANAKAGKFVAFSRRKSGWCC